MCTLSAYRPAPQGPGLFMSPSDGSAEPTDRRRHLVPREVCGCELVPPVTTDPGARASVQSPGGISLGRVDESQRNMLSDNINGHLQVAVVAHDDGSVHVPAQNVDEHVTCDVDIAALLFAPRHRCHERRTSDVGPLGVSNHDGPVGLGEDGASAAIGCGQRGRGCPGHVVSVLDHVDGAVMAKALR